MKQLTFIITGLLFLSGCVLPFDNVDKCPEISLSLSQKTKDWIAPMTAKASGDSIAFVNSVGEEIYLAVTKQTFEVFKTPQTDCPIKLTQNLIIYSGNNNPFTYMSSTLSIVSMTQNISILPMNSFCDMSKLNTFNTQDEVITNRNGLLNYIIIPDFDFKGEKLKTLNGQFSLSSDNCVSSQFTNITEFWITQKYGLIQFKDLYNVIWTRKM